jgi:mRNA interferase MazF
MVISRGAIFWVDLGEPLGSAPGYQRPVVVVQADEFNGSALATVVVAALTSNLKYRKLPGCVFLSATESGLPKDSVIDLTQIQTLDRDLLTERIGEVPDDLMQSVERALQQVLGLY